jgi:hypothetical protein
MKSCSAGHNSRNPDDRLVRHDMIDLDVARDDVRHCHIAHRHPRHLDLAVVDPGQSRASGAAIAMEPPPISAMLRPAPATMRITSVS